MNSNARLVVCNIMYARAFCTIDENCDVYTCKNYSRAYIRLLINCNSTYVVRFFFSSRRRHTRWPRDWSSDVCSSDLVLDVPIEMAEHLMEELTYDYEHVNRGMKIIQSNEIYHLTTKPEHSQYYKKLRSEERRVGKECRNRRSPDD